MAGVRELEQRVLSFVRREAVLRPDEPVLLLLSGGADSMAMLSLTRLVDRRLRLGLHLAALHVDYGLRGEESSRDREIVEAACLETGVALEVVRLEGRLRGANFQARARELRYERARELCAERGFDTIAIAHNRDDQAETILYRLTKYASPLAVAGMRPREAAGPERPALARPLLCLGAGEVRAYCAARGIAYGEDVTNAAPLYARNLLRLEVLPRLAQINPRVAETLAAGAELAAAERDVLAEAVAQAWERAARPAGEGETALAVDALAAEPRALRLLCLRELARQALGRDALVERRLVDGLDRLAGRADDAGRVDLGGGWEVARGGGLLRLRRRRAPHACAPVHLILPPPAGSAAKGFTTPDAAGVLRARDDAEGRQPSAAAARNEAVEPFASLAFCGRRYEARLVSGGMPPPKASRALQAWVGLDERPRQVVLRHARRGDRFQPLGQPAATTVARFLAAARVPLDDRAVALVLEIDGAVVWVGYARGGQRLGRVAQPRRVTESTALTFHLAEEDA